MRSSERGLVALVSLLALTLASCSIYGVTSSFVLAAPEPLPSGLHHRVEGGSVTIGPRANRVYAVGVNDMGGFRPGDRQVMEASLKDTFAEIHWPGDLPAWTTHTMVRLYVAAYNNSSGALLSSIAWCLMDDTGEVIYEEQFYAATTEGFTLGSAKDLLNKAIVRRIQRSAVLLAASDPRPETLPVVGDYIHESIDDAVGELPRSMFSSQIGNVGDNAINWTSTDPRDPIDWPSLVAVR